MSEREPQFFERLIRLEERQRTDHENLRALGTEMRDIAASLKTIESSILEVKLTLNQRINQRMWAVVGGVALVAGTAAKVMGVL